MATFTQEIEVLSNLTIRVKETGVSSTVTIVTYHDSKNGQKSVSYSVPVDLDDEIVKHLEDQLAVYTKRYLDEAITAKHAAKQVAANKGEI